MGTLLSNYYIDVNMVEFLDKSNPSVPFTSKGYKYKSSKTVLEQAGMPAIFFRLELSPVKVRYTLFYKHLIDYLSEVCAIVGGTFVVIGFVEAAIANGIKVVHGEDKQH